ncbi:MAG: type IX secretion system membrane protein PorP/SprF [Bacteroidota bacterium]
MKKNLLLVCLILFALTGRSQQEALHTQFIFNKIGFNPAAAGSSEAACLTAIYRQQWIGLEGAPESQVLSFHAPLLNKRIGLGLQMQRSTVGISENFTANGMYSYRLRLGKGALGIGIQASVRYWGMDYNDPRLQATQDLSTDGGLPVGQQQRYLPNFGTGVYYHTNRFFIGFSVPRMVNNSIDFNDLSGVLSRERRHLYFMTGLSLRLNQYTELLPQLLLRYANHTPLSADFNLSLQIAERYTIGTTYRHSYHRGDRSVLGSESIDLLLSAQLTNELLFGFSYDITLSELKDYSNGSIEGILRYCFGKPEGQDVINPRYF